MTLKSLLEKRQVITASQGPKDIKGVTVSQDARVDSARAKHLIAYVFLNVIVAYRVRTSSTYVLHYQLLSFSYHLTRLSTLLVH